MQIRPLKDYAEPPVFLHAPQAAACVPLPLRSFHSYVARGLIPSYKIGRHRLFKREEVIAAIERQRVGSMSEVLS